MEDRSARQLAFAVVLLTVLFALPVTVAAQPQHGAARTVTRTRLQVLFSALETQ